MRKLILSALIVLFSTTAQAQSTVYVTRDISPESLIKIYKALGRKAKGRVAVKVSTGEAGNPNYLQPALIGKLVKKVKGTIVECNTAYPGKRNTVEEHMRVAEEHGFTKIAKVDIMDAEGEFRIPVRDTANIKYDLVGVGLKNYDFMVNLSHFKGHPMGGLGGAIKNQSIGVASAGGKAYIHAAGNRKDIDRHIGFLESMAAAAQGVADYFGDRIIYINVMNNMSVDCDCVAHPAAPVLKDYGILASLDPVALDQACVDIIFNMTATEDNNNEPLKKRITSLHGTHTIDHAEKIGLGSKKYTLVNIDR